METFCSPGVILSTWFTWFSRRSHLVFRCDIKHLVHLVHQVVRDLRSHLAVLALPALLADRLAQLDLQAPAYNRNKLQSKALTELKPPRVANVAILTKFQMRTQYRDHV